ncbi:expressed unknown protein [Ectocarpus siliculosus]|uniref:STIL N-terminal domain-containing protein n=1 Tax=Ectocarpus siliculosus TaxID=2880 RepID=D8LES1_ECTSI|nr:expressed unknown protein [Ectocarpus siliculosus]|eukprot:CBN79741.1 expressed unknown protein [Ectocarpus siliculosus]
MARRPHPTLAVTDSERTLILQRRNSGGKPSRAKRRVSSYFAAEEASDTSAESLASCSRRDGRTGTTACISTADKTKDISSLAGGGGSSRTGGRWILEGIRHSRQGQVLQPAKDGNDSIISPAGPAAAVFYGSVRFPASRVALWNRRPTGSPLTLTPESAAPILVLRQRAADLIASELLSLAAEGERWHGVLGSTGDILQGSSLASDPRLLAASSSSSSNAPFSCLALEIAGMKAGEAAAAAAAAAAQKRDGDTGELRPSARRRRAAPPRGRRCVVALSGAAASGGGEGRGGRGSTEGNDDDEVYYSSLLDDCINRVGAAKSADPPTFTPLRLQCSLKGRRGGATDSRGSGGCDNGVDGETSPSARKQHRQAGSANGGSGAGQPAPLQGAATLSLRAEMIAPALGVRLTPIAAPALLHTALYQSLLSRGAEDKLQSGLVTLNEGRRAVLLSDNDPLSLRAPIVGVWVSGGDSGGTGGVGTPSGQQQQSGRRLSPLTHPYVYPACLRFLLGFRGGSGASKSTTAAAAAAAASPVAFLVLQLPGGVGGGTPGCYEACAVSASAATPTAAGGGGMRVASVGFEQLDFSADVDVSVGGGGREGGATGGGASSANRAVVIARLRRVSSLTAAGGAFGRALARARGRYRGTQQAENGAATPPFLPSPSATRTPPQPSPQQRPPPPRSIGATQRWHSRHHSQPTPEDRENEGPTEVQQDRPLLHPPVPIAAPTKPVVHSPRSAASKADSSPARATGRTSAINTPEKILSHAIHHSTSPAKRGLRGGSGPRASVLGGAGEGTTRPGDGHGRPRPPWRSQEEGFRELSSGGGGSSHRMAAVEGREASSSSPPSLPEKGEELPSPSPAPVAAAAVAAAAPAWTPRNSLDLLALAPEATGDTAWAQQAMPPPSEAPYNRAKSMVEASTNTSLFWGAPLMPQAAAAAAGGSPTRPGTVVLATKAAFDTPEGERCHHASKGGGGGEGGGGGGGEAEENAVAPLPSSRRSETPTPPSAAHAGAAVRHGWTTQRGRRRRRRAGAGERQRHRNGGNAGGERDSSGDDDASDGGASTAWSRNSSDVDEGETTTSLELLPLRVPPPAGLGSGSGASAARLNSSVSSAGSAHRIDDNASKDDKASGTTGEEEGREGQQAVVIVTPERNGSCDGGRGRQPLLGRRGGERGGAWGVPIVPVADLMVVPRIEFGQMTDDEMGSDLDEGETIGRIESKYLQGGGSVAPFLRC